MLRVFLAGGPLFGAPDSVVPKTFVHKEVTAVNAGAKSKGNEKNAKNGQM